MSTTSQFQLPLGYTKAPPWPALYWPFTNFDPRLGLDPDIPHSLYFLSDIWYFTMLWTAVLALVVYTAAGLIALVMFLKARTFHLLLLAPMLVLFIALGVFAAFVSGSVVGVVLGVIYNAGFFTMSTWVPFLWGLIQVLIIVMSSYSTITTIL